MTSAVSYVPSPRQRAFHTAPQPRRWYCAGYGSGKTTAAVIEALLAATVHHPGYTGIVCAPTFPLLVQGWLAEWRRWVPASLYSLREGTSPVITMPTPSGTSTILLRSTTHAHSLEAVNAAWVVFDEATREPSPDPYRVLLGRLRRGYPGRQRTMILTGPPSTRRHWTAAEFGAGPGAKHQGTQLDWHDQHQAVTRARTRDNPHLPPTYEPAIRSRPGATRAWCAQYLDAEFGSVEGQVYEMWSRSAHVVPAASLAGRRWRRVVVGTDWGWSHPGAMVTVASDGYGDLYVVAEEVHRQRLVADVPGGWCQIGAALEAAHGPEAFACDPSMPGNIAALHRTVRARCYGADNDVGEGIRRVGAHLERALARKPGTPGPAALWVSDACPQLIGELEGYAHRRHRDGSFSDDPEETGDDAADALRYAVMALTRAA